MINLTLEQVKKIAEEGKYRNIPLSTEIFSDMHTPLTVLEILQNVSSHCYMLESVEDKQSGATETSKQES